MWVRGSYSCCVFRRRTTQLEEGEAGTLQPVFARVAQHWMEFMVQIGETLLPPPSLWPSPQPPAPSPEPHHNLCARDPGCASVSRSSTHMVSRFLLPSVLSEFTILVTSMAGDTSVRIFEQHL